MSNLNVPQEEPVRADNAGIVLLAPYLPRLFSMLSCLDQESRKFKGKMEQFKALAVLNYVVTGKDGSVPNEKYIMNRLLTGVDISEVIPHLPETTTEERDVCASMLKAVLCNWDKLRNTSVDAFRGAFLSRPGTIGLHENYIPVTMEIKPYDLLLDTIPWNFRMIRFPWMEKRIEVRWR